MMSYPSLRNSNICRSLEQLKIISDGKFMDNFSYRSMITCIRRNRVDAILMYSPLRISIYPDLYEEFKLFCKLNKVSVICLCDFE